MEEIAEWFKEEYTELLSRYKDKLTNPQIMSVLQSVTKKQIGFKDNPERLERIFNNAVHNVVDVNGLKVPAELLEEPNSDFRKIMRGEVNGCFDVMCEDCTKKDCNARRLGLI